MKKFFKSAVFKILLFFIAFLVGLMIYAVTKGGYSVSAASVINTLTKPFRSISNSVAVRFEGTFDKITKADEYYQENQELHEKVNELNRKLADYDDLKAEVEELRKFAEIKEMYPDFDMSMPADVLGYVTNDPFRSFTINRGSNDGIEPYCPVATTDGIIGITIEVSDEVSTVRTILSPDLSIAAVCSATNADYGLVEGSVLMADKGVTKMTHLSTEHKLNVGDLIVTAGNSGMFPKGFPIGTVKSFDVEVNGLSACAEIEPCVDVTRLSSVFVVTGFRGKKEASDED